VTPLRRAFVVRDPTPIPPLGEPASQAWLLGGRLGAQMRAHLEAAGLVVEVVDAMAEALARAAVDGGIVVGDAVAFTPTVLRGLLAAPPAPLTIAALPEADVTRRLAFVGGLTPISVAGAAAFTAPLYRVAPGSTAALADATPHVLPLREHVARFPVPPGLTGKPELVIGLSDTYLCHVDHWVHVLRVNQAALAAHWVTPTTTWGGRAWYLWRALLGFPWRGGRIAASIRQVHRGAKIHHTAHVELSVIEDGVEIGANAVIKSSWIGKGARVDDGAIVNGSVVGEGASVASLSAITGVVLYPRSFASQQKMQLSILGEGAVALTGSWFYDLNFGRHVRVAHRGRVVDSGDQFLGVCAGPWSRVAGGVWVASGREIPAGALIVQSPSQVLTTIDGVLAATQLTATDGPRLIGLGPLPDDRPAEAQRLLGAPAAGSLDDEPAR
jgi:hypothetical protein